MKRTLSQSMVKKQPPRKRVKNQKKLPRALAQTLNYRTTIPEYKVTDNITSNQSVTTTGIIHNCTTNLVRGTGALNNFIGNNVTPVGLQVRYQIVSGESSSIIPVGPDTNNMTRVVVFQWLSDTVPAISDIFQSTAGLAPISPWKQENLDKLNILSDRNYATWLVSYQYNSLSTTISGNAYTDSVYIKGKKLLPIQFSQAATPNQNNIYVVFIADSTAVPHPTCSCMTRITYTD